MAAASGQGSYADVRISAVGGGSQESTISWNDQPSQGASYLQTRETLAALMSWNVRNLVQDRVDGVVPEHGLLVETDPLGIGSSTGVTFDSRELSFQRAPELCITWEPPQDAGAEELADASPRRGHLR